MSETWKDELDGTIQSLIGRHVRDGRGLADAPDRHVDDRPGSLDDQAFVEQCVREVAVDDSVELLARARAEGEAEQLVGLARCARCGCTESTPCQEGCGWEAPNLCTNCAADELV